VLADTIGIRATQLYANHQKKVRGFDIGDFLMQYEIAELIIWLIFIWGLFRLLKQKKW
jgi:hypothetical protein